MTTKKPISVKQLDKMLELKEKGLALREIAKIVGLSQEGVRQTIKKYGWTRGTKNKMKVCVICGEKYTGFGNNAEPIKKGLCCDGCNHQVIEERIKRSNLAETKSPQGNKNLWII